MIWFSKITVKFHFLIYLFSIKMQHICLSLAADCSRPFHENRQTFKQNDYIRIWKLNLKSYEPAFVFSVKTCKNARIRLLTTTDLNSLGYNFNIDIKDGNSFATSIKLVGSYICFCAFWLFT